MAGVSSMAKEPVPDEVYFRRLEQAIGQLGRLPKTSERKKFGLNFRKGRYPTLAAFIKRAADLGRIPPQLASPPDTAATKSADQPPPENSIRLAREEPGAVPPIPLLTKRRQWARTALRGFPYAPQDELGVVALFAILCAQGVIAWEILELRGGKGIDATCYDQVMRRELRVELKHTVSRGSWNHPAFAC